MNIVESRPQIARSSSKSTSMGMYTLAGGRELSDPDNPIGAGPTLTPTQGQGVSARGSLCEQLIL